MTRSHMTLTPSHSKLLVCRFVAVLWLGRPPGRGQGGTGNKSERQDWAEEEGEPTCLTPLGAEAGAVSRDDIRATNSM